MSQHDYSIANQTGLEFRADMNNVLAAIVTDNSGSTEPATTFPGMVWRDTSVSPSVLKKRNDANDAWVTVLTAAGEAISGASTASAQRTAMDAQATLISGTNIKTINGVSVLGSGDLSVSSTDGDKGDITVSGSGSTWTIDNSVVTRAKADNDLNSGLAKVWVNFNGTGTVAIRANYNVSSITDNGLGDYTVNFASALVDANYSIAGMGDLAGGIVLGMTSGTTPPTSSSVRIRAYNSAWAASDPPYAAITIFH